MPPVHVVTGANSGIGKAAAQALAARGAHVALVCRSREKAEQAIDDIRRAEPAASLELFLADLSSLAEIRRVADELIGAHPRIDVLFNNAGVYLHSRQVTAEGFEAMFALNHLGYFLLTERLLPALRRAAPARVVSVSSMGHKGGKVPIDDLNCEQGFDAMRQYCNTKLMNILFTKELARREGEQGVVANCFHPGAVATGFAQDDAGLFGSLVKLARPFLRTAEKAAHTGVLLATAPEFGDVTGEYFVNGKPRTPSRAARDPEMARRLWDVSARLVESA